MKRRLAWASFGLGMIAVMPSLHAAERARPDLFRLSNGLEVAFFEKAKLPILDISLVFLKGSRNDPIGKSGTLEFLGRVMARPYQKEAERLGGELEVDVSTESFMIHAHGLSSDREAWLGLIAQSVLHPSFDEHDFEFEKARAIEARKHVSDHVETLASLAIFRLLFSGTPYLRVGFPPLQEIMGIRLADLQQAFTEILTPAHAELIVLGDATRASWKTKIENLFAPWVDRRSELSERIEFNGIRARPGDIWMVDRPASTQIQLFSAMAVARFSDPDTLPLLILNTILGDSTQSRLNRVLRDESGLTYGVSSQVTFHKDFAYLGIRASTAPETVAPLIQKLRTQIVELSQGKISEAEVRFAKDYWLGSYTLSHATLPSIAQRWLTYRILNLPEVEENVFLSQMEQVTLAQVQSVAKRYLSQDRWKFVLAGDAAKIISSLKKARFKAPRLFQIPR